MSWCFSDVRPKELFTKHSNGRWSGTLWRSCDISGMEFCIIYEDLLHPFVPLQWRHNERDGFLNHRCLDCLLNRLFRHNSWIYLNLKQLQNSVHEYLCQDNSSLFKLMAWQWTDAKPFPEQYHFTYAHLSPGRSSSQRDECNSAMMREGEKQELRLFQREFPRGSPRPLFIKIRKVTIWTW